MNPNPAPTAEPAEDPRFEALLDYLHSSRGFDFTGYKRSSLGRRILKRMQMVKIADFGDYMDFLEVHPEEFGSLFDTILINVTSFFRDPTAWNTIAEEVIPRILATKGPDEPIRFWSAGAANGQEACTLAMVLAESLGVEHFRDRVKIYATDVDEEALSRARHASYSAKEVETVPGDLLGKYFEPVNHRYHFVKDLRRSIIFGRHDLIQDAPISRIDLLVCRNTLMYFNSEIQGRILDRFHFALNDRGFLFLGKAETLLTYAQTYLPVDLKRRIFTKVGRGPLPNDARRWGTVRPPRPGPRDAAMEPDRTVVDDPIARIRDAAFDTSPVAQLVVDPAGMLSLANLRARVIFGLTSADLGRFIQDMPISYRPAELRSCLDRAYAERRPVLLNDVEWSGGVGDITYLDVEVVPLLGPTGSALGASIAFIDATNTRRLKHELQQSHRELETAYEELQSSNEELETTNEELQSTVEELETTNEELQSTNEELETMNEELQSTNEELETLNGEIRERGDEINRVNTFLRGILASLRGGVVVIDHDLNVNLWNDRAMDLWGLRGEEVRGKNFLNLDIGLPVHELKQMIRSCLAGDILVREILLGATNRRGKAIHCKVTCTPMHKDGAIHGVILMMDEGDGRAPPDIAPTNGPGEA